MKHQKIDQPYLVGVFDLLNDRYFKGELEEIPIEFFSLRDTKRKFGKRYRVRTTLRGYFHYDIKEDKPIAIGINKDYRNTIEYTLLRRTILHEMVHYYFFLRRGKTYKQMFVKGDGHTDQFKRKFKRLAKKEARHLTKQFKKAIDNSFIGE